MSSYSKYIIDQLAGFNGVYEKRMFGGIGLFRGNLMFGIIFDDQLYLKKGIANQSDWEGRSLFTYQSKGREIALSYYAIDPDIVDNSSELCEYAARAFDSALLAKDK